MAGPISIRVFSSAWVNSTPDFCGGVGIHSNEGTVMIPMLSTLVSVPGVDGVPRHVLVDCGVPNVPRPGGRPAPRDWQAPSETLGAMGIAPDAIDLLVLTHLHRDHCATLADFGSATVVVQRAELDGWQRTLGAPERALPQGESSWIRRPIEVPVITGLAAAAARGEAGLRLLDGPADLGDGLSVACSDGHSFGSQWLLVDGGAGRRYVIAGDTVMWYSNLEEMWPPGAGQGRSIQLIDDFLGIREFVDDEIEHVVPGHDPRLFERFETFPCGAASCVELIVADWDRPWPRPDQVSGGVGA
jgi:glyoxylase-like metal-dependent hydrolase (beta-lactamase superfamily II)